jgi:hypothetical protein
MYTNTLSLQYITGIYLGWSRGQYVLIRAKSIYVSRYSVTNQRESRGIVILFHVFTSNSHHKKIFWAQDTHKVNVFSDITIVRLFWKAALAMIIWISIIQPRTIIRMYLFSQCCDHYTSHSSVWHYHVTLSNYYMNYTSIISHNIPIWKLIVNVTEKVTVWFDGISAHQYHIFCSIMMNYY